MKNLDLPNLRELYLHRNLIEDIDGLSGCPLLKRLWLCQNKLTGISGLHCVPELEELYLQGNHINNLDGLETCEMSLLSLGLAGNPIDEFGELHKLCQLRRLRELSCADIHFGSCPIAEQPGYKDFVLSYFEFVRVLDGVVVNADNQFQAELSYLEQVSAEQSRAEQSSVHGH